MQENGLTRIQLCGTLSAEIGGRHVETQLRGRQGRLLFAYLVLNRDRAVSREELVGAVWPYHAPAETDNALRALLSKLRRALGDGAVEGRDELRLTLPSGATVDVEAADEAMSRARAAVSAGRWAEGWSAAQASIATTRQDLLPGHDSPWLESERRALQDLRVEALELTAEACLALGGSEVAGAERAGRALLELAPFRESGHSALMRSLAAGGNTAEALRVFEDLRGLLREELGAFPSPELQELHAHLLGGSAVRNGTPERRQPVPAALHAEPEGTFVGREPELAAGLTAWARALQEGRRLLLVGGEAGAGKTRLCAALAERLHAEGAHVLYGRCDEEPPLAYQPFVEALRQHADGCDPGELRRQVGPGGGELARVMPELADMLPGLPSPVRGEPDTERHRLFQAMAEVLFAIARRRPLLLVLDDLHWADTPTALMLEHCLRVAEPAPGQTAAAGHLPARGGRRAARADRVL